MQNWKAAPLPQSLIFFLILFAWNFSGKAADSFSIAPPAAWVDVQSELYPATNSADENVRYILVDHQVNVPRNEHYHRIVEEAENANGVQDCAQLSLDFDPSCQRLIIHNICIRRGTNILNRLEPDKIKVIQQEKDLDMNIYNGEVSAVVFLEDVRVGDEIDYSYTITGSNPIFGNHYLDQFYLQWNDPVSEERFRLLWPANRYLGIKDHGRDVPPVVRESGGLKEYVWELHNLPGINEEDSLPSWYDPYPWIQFSDFASWKDVAEWAAPLYPRPEPLDPKLEEKIQEWERLYPEPKARLAAALTFVQDEIRYMGIEVGPNSHKPNEPSVVFTRRFGDCKDKAYLFCTLLQAMGIDATEALVDTESAGAVSDWLPSPYAFNHVVTRVQLDGEIYWLDPTQLHQGGAIDNRFFPDFGCCLLVRHPSDGLTPIPQQSTGWPKTTVQETFFVHGRKEPAGFTVRTLAEGYDADQLRETFAERRRDELQKNYLNYYAKEYPKISVAKPLEVIDHREQNIFETIEHYTIREFWTLSDDKQQYECDFYPQTIRDLFDEPTTRLRSMPLAITYPQHMILQTHVLLPESWPLTNEVEHFESTAARLDAKRDVGTNSFQIVYDYEALTNFVSTNEMPGYVKTLEQMKSALGYSLTWGIEDETAAKKPAAGGINWAIVALGAIYLLLLVVIAGAALRFQPQVPPVLPNQPPLPLSGLGGWLILPAFRLIIGPFIIFYTIASNGSAYSIQTWHTLTDPSGAAYNSLWAPVLIFELLVNLTSLVFDVLLLALFFQKRHIFPRLYIIFLVFIAVTTTIDNVLAHAVLTNSSDTIPDRTLIQTYIACLIWIPYMRVSERVKATFTR